VELFPILKNFDCHWFFILVIIASQDDTKGTSAEFLLYLISILNLVFGLVDIISLSVIEAKVIDASRISIPVGILILAGQFFTIIPTDTLKSGIQIDIIYLFKCHDFFFFIL